MHTLVIGGGTTGPSLAPYLTLVGHNTVLVSCLSEMLAGAEAAIKMGYRKLANTELLPTTAEGWCGRFTSFTNMVEAVQNFDIAFEAISEIAAQCSCKDRVAVTHFANPPHLIPVVKVVPGNSTDSVVMDRLCAFVRGLGKQPIRPKLDLTGHLFNRLQFALMREAFALVRSGVADTEDIDKVVKEGYALRLTAEGQLEKVDLTGLSPVANVARCPDLDSSQTPEDLTSMNQDGNSGAETGRGFLRLDAGTQRSGDG